MLQLSKILGIPPSTILIWPLYPCAHFRRGPKIFKKGNQEDLVLSKGALFCLKWRKRGPWDKKRKPKGGPKSTKKSLEGNQNGHSALWRCTPLDYATILCLCHLSVKHQHHHIHPLFLWFTHQTPQRRYLSHLSLRNLFFLLMKSILPINGIYSSYWWNLFFLLMESILPIDGTTFSLVHAWAVPVARILAFICSCAVKREGVFRSKMCKCWILTIHCSIRGLEFWIYDLRLNYKISTLNLARNIFFMLSSS